MSSISSSSSRSSVTASTPRRRSRCAARCVRAGRRALAEVPALDAGELLAAQARVAREISNEHLARLSPLQHEHILMLGTFPFTLPHELADGQRRRLRIGDGSA